MDAWPVISPRVARGREETEGTGGRLPRVPPPRDCIALAGYVLDVIERGAELGEMAEDEVDTGRHMMRHWVG